MHSLLTHFRRVPRPLLPQMGKMTGCSDFAVATNGAADAAAKASLMAAQAAGAAGTASGAATQAYIEHIFNKEQALLKSRQEKAQDDPTFWSRHNKRMMATKYSPMPKGPPKLDEQGKKLERDADEVAWMIAMLKEMDAYFRPYLWSDEQWDKFKTKYGMKGLLHCIPYHLRHILHPEHRHVLDMFNWVPTHYILEGKAPNLLKQRSKAWKAHKYYRNGLVRDYLTRTWEIRHESGEAEGSGSGAKGRIKYVDDSAANVTDDEPCGRAPLDEAHDGGTSDVTERWAIDDLIDTWKRFDVSTSSSWLSSSQSSSSHSSSQASTGSSQSNAVPNEEQQAAEELQTLVARLLATGCAQNALLTYRGGCKMITSLGKVRTLVHQKLQPFVQTGQVAKADAAALVELWGWIAGTLKVATLKVASAIDHLRERLEQDVPLDHWGVMATENYWCELLTGKFVMGHPSWDMLEMNDRYMLELRILSGGHFKAIKGVKSFRGPSGMIAWLEQSTDNRTRYFDLCKAMSTKADAAEVAALYDAAGMRRAGLPGSGTDYFSSWVARANHPHSTAELPMSSTLEGESLPLGLRDLTIAILGDQLKKCHAHRDLVAFVRAQGDPLLKCVQCEMLKVVKYLKKATTLFNPTQQTECEETSADFVPISNPAVRIQMLELSAKLELVLEGWHADGTVPANFPWRLSRSANDWDRASSVGSNKVVRWKYQCFTEEAELGASYPCVTSWRIPVGIMAFLASHEAAQYLHRPYITNPYHFLPDDVSPIASGESDMDDLFSLSESDLDSSSLAAAAGDTVS